MIRILNIILTLGVIGSCFLLISTIKEPIDFDTEFKKRDAEVKEKLLYIKDLQIAYKDAKGGFTNSFDSLVHFANTDSITITKVIGDPDELDVEGNPVPVTFEYIRMAIKDTLVKPKYPLETIHNIPNVDGEVFSMDSGKIRKSRITVPVFEVKATYPQMLKGMNSNYIDPTKLRAVGSMVEPKYNGNWD